MSTIYSVIVFTSFLLISLVAGHARIKYPRPLAAPDDSPGGNHYNGPLRADGSDFPCKGLHKRADINKNPTATWTPGTMTHFEILGHNSAWGEGSLAAHSGGSCQASISFDNGETWKVLHSFIGGCPRGVRLGSNMAGPNQTFPFLIPVNTKAGNALFSWSWVAVTGNRNEYFQNCASVLISGTGTSKLDHLPDMFVGDMTLTGHIGPGECRSTAGFSLEYPNPGTATTMIKVDNIGFKKPTNGKCYSKATVNNTIVPTLSTARVSGSTPSSSSSLSTARTTASTSSTVRLLSTTRATTTTTTQKTTSTMEPLPTVSSSPNGLPAQCTNYAVITDRTRHSAQPGYITCDKARFTSEPTWVRFSGGAGTRLVKGPAEPFRCGTQGAGWLSTPDPPNPGDTISAKVCYSWPGNSCQWSNRISVTNCKGFYVYGLVAPPACYLRYCTV